MSSFVATAFKYAVAFEQNTFESKLSKLFQETSLHTVILVPVALIGGISKDGTVLLLYISNSHPIIGMKQLE